VPLPYPFRYSPGWSAGCSPSSDINGPTCSASPGAAGRPNIWRCRNPRRCRRLVLVATVMVPAAPGAAADGDGPRAREVELAADHGVFPGASVGEVDPRPGRSRSFPRCGVLALRPDCAGALLQVAGSSTMSTASLSSRWPVTQSRRSSRTPSVSQPARLCRCFVPRGSGSPACTAKVPASVRPPRRSTVRRHRLNASMAAGLRAPVAPGDRDESHNPFDRRLPRPFPKPARGRRQQPSSPSSRKTTTVPALGTSPTTSARRITSSRALSAAAVIPSREPRVRLGCAGSGGLWRTAGPL
jgi:hypothetical protein